MSSQPTLFWCLGGVLIDHIGRMRDTVLTGQSNPGAARIAPGGVALNIAQALARKGARVALAGAVGRDIGADMIAAALAATGVQDRLIRTDDATGAYLAVETADGDMFVGVSDLSALERLPAEDLSAALAAAPAAARLMIDANLTPAHLRAVAARSGWLGAEAVSAPKAPRLVPLLPRLDALFCNLGEAAAMGAPAADARSAALTLAGRCKGAVFVTDGPRPAAVAHDDAVWTATPPPAPPASVTGAGDAFTAAAALSLATGGDPPHALGAAIAAASAHLETQS